MRIKDIVWDEGNVAHIEQGKGISPEEVEEIFSGRPYYRKTKKGHHAAFGPTLEGRYLVIIFELMRDGKARPITGWDMSSKELALWRRHS